MRLTSGCGPIDVICSQFFDRIMLNLSM